MKKVSVGDCVVYVNRDGQEVAGVCSFVWSSTKIDLKVHVQATEVEVEKVAYSSKGELRTWHWPAEKVVQGSRPSSGPKKAGPSDPKRPDSVQEGYPGRAPIPPELWEPRYVRHMTWDRTFCTRHGQPFREATTREVANFLIKGLFKLDLFGKAPAGLALGDTVGWVALQLSDLPLCCRLENGDLLIAVLGSKAWPVLPCAHCKNTREGGPYESTGPDRKLQVLRHVCLWCVIWSLEPDPGLATEAELERYRAEKGI